MSPLTLSSASNIASWLEGMPTGEPPLQQHHVRVTARVTACRRNKGITFCDAKLLGTEDGILQLVITMDYFKTDGLRLKAFSALVSPGATVAVLGLPGCDRAGTLSLYVTELQLVRCDESPSAVMRLVDLAATGVITLVEASVALSSELEFLVELVALSVQAKDDAPGSKQKRYDYKQAVQRTSRVLQGLSPERTNRARPPKLSSSDAVMLEALEARLLLSWPVHPGVLAASEHGVSSRVAKAVEAQMSDIRSLRDPSACCARGPGTRSDYLHGKKRPQVEW